MGPTTSKNECNQVCVKIHCIMECRDMTIKECRHLPWRDKLDRYETNQEEERDMTNTIWSEQMCEEVHYTVECRDVATQKWEHGPMWYYLDVATGKHVLQDGGTKVTRRLTDVMTNGVVKQQHRAPDVTVLRGL